MDKKERERLHRRIVKHYRRCKNVAEVAEAFAVGESTVRKICRDNGISFRRSPEERRLANIVNTVYEVLRGTDDASKIADKHGLEEWEVRQVSDEVTRSGLAKEIADLRSRATGTTAEEYDIMAQLIDGKSGNEIARATGYDRDLVNRVRQMFKASDLWDKIKARKKGVVSPRPMKPTTYGVIKLMQDGKTNVEISDAMGIDQKYVSKIRTLCKAHGLVAD